MKDLEQPNTSIRQRKNGDNTANSSQRPPSSSSDHHLPARHPINIIYRSGVMAGSLYLLHYLEVFATVMRGPSVKHGWFKIGLAASVAIQMMKGYIELYDGKSKRQKNRIHQLPHRNTHHPPPHPHRLHLLPCGTLARIRPAQDGTGYVFGGMGNFVTACAFDAYVVSEWGGYGWDDVFVAAVSII
jgi:hypothetical protein